jgi:hypothetical protein
MLPTHSPTTARRRRAGLVAAAAAIVVLAAACVPPPPPPTTTTTTTTSTTSTTTVPAGPAITVDEELVNVTPGTTVTVTGSGFDATGYLGTRPPFLGQPGGVFVVFARAGDPWQPSLGAPGSSRQIIFQRWALPQAQFNQLAGNPAAVLMNPDGSFTTTLTLNEAPGTGEYKILVYPGSGAVDATAELELPVSFAPPAP